MSGSKAIDMREPSLLELLDELRGLRGEVRALRAAVRSGAGAPRGVALLDTAQVADALGLEAESVRRRHRSGSLPSIPNTRPLRFRADVVEAYMLGQRGRDLRAMNRI